MLRLTPCVRPAVRNAMDRAGRPQQCVTVTEQQFVPALSPIVVSTLAKALSTSKVPQEEGAPETRGRSYSGAAVYGRSKAQQSTDQHAMCTQPKHDPVPTKLHLQLHKGMNLHIATHDHSHVRLHATASSPPPGSLGCGYNGGRVPGVHGVRHAVVLTSDAQADGHRNLGQRPENKRSIKASHLRMHHYARTSSCMCTCSLCPCPRRYWATAKANGED